MWVRAPLPVPKRKTRLTSCLSFWIPQAKGLLHPSVFECSGKVNSPCAKVFACAKTLVRRKSAAGQKAGWVILLQRSRQYQILILTAPLQNGRHDPRSCLPFFVCDPRFFLFRNLCRYSVSSREVPLAKYALVHFTTTPDRRARAMRLGSAMRPFRVSAMSQTNSRSTVAPTTMTMTYRI